VRRASWQLGRTYGPRSECCSLLAPGVTCIQGGGSSSAAQEVRRATAAGATAAGTTAASPPSQEVARQRRRRCCCWRAAAPGCPTWCGARSRGCRGSPPASMRGCWRRWQTCRASVRLARTATAAHRTSTSTIESHALFSDDCVANQLHKQINLCCIAALCNYLDQRVAITKCVLVMRINEYSNNRNHER
jgi:hypothetical protein